ncbi:peptidase U62 modulator of DNA gyrase, partial [mine drainage metagenome]
MEIPDIDRILEKLSAGAKYAEVRFMGTKSSSMSYRNEEFTGQDFSETSGIAVRCLNESIAISFIDSLSSEKIDRGIGMALKNSRKPGRNKLDQSGGLTASWNKLGKKLVVDTDPSTKSEFLRDCSLTMKNNGADVRINALFDSVTESIFMNSSGSKIEGNFSRIGYMHLTGVKGPDGFEQSYQQFGVTGGYDDFENLHIQEKIPQELNSLKEASIAHTINPGVYDVIVGPDISGIVAHESCGHPTEFDRIRGREGSLAGESFLSGKKFPFRIGSEVVNVIDDPTIPNSYGYYMYDDEGIKSRKRYLYRSGKTDKFIHSRESAAIIGVDPNGGGRSSSWDMEPLARMSTTYIEPGDYELDELIENI